MPPEKQPSVSRVQFIERFVSRGFNYTQACDAYEAMVSLFEDAIVQGRRVNIGKVGALMPVRMEPKVVHMGFKTDGGKLRKVRREYVLGRRVKFKFNLHKAFIRQHQLGWF